MVELRFLCTALPFIARNSIPSLESFKHMVTMLRSGQEMLYKNNQRETISKQNKVELRILCTAIPVFVRNMHTKFGII